MCVLVLEMVTALGLIAIVDLGSGRELALKMIAFDLEADVAAILKRQGLPFEVAIVVTHAERTPLHSSNQSPHLRHRSA